MENSADYTPSKASISDDDPHVCAVCQDGTVYENNEIIFCDRCNVAVHQTCYGVFTIPEGSWFCQVCAAGGNPETTACELCSNTGGAYKMVNGQSNRWAHALCATWIPELYSVDSKGVSAINFSYFDKKRFRLKCSLCTTKGAAIQCSYGRCTSAVHPWCVIFNPKGFAHRIVKDESGEPLWEIFCKQHAHAVTEPVKPKPKSKSQPLTENPDEIFSSDVQESHEAAWDLVTDKVKRNSSASVRNSSSFLTSSQAPMEYNFGYPSLGTTNKVSMAHALRFGQSITKLKDQNNDQDSNDEASDESESDVDEQKSSRQAGKSKKGGKGVTLNTNRDNSNKFSSVNPKSTTNHKRFAVRVLSEWPGMSEGEGLDLDHFWNVVSMSYPEDHSVEWANFMASPFVSTDDEAPPPFVDGAVFDIPPLGDKKSLNELSHLSDEKIAFIPSDRERQYLYDPDKRNNFLLSVYSNIATLNQTSLSSLATKNFMVNLLEGTNCFPPDNAEDLSESFPLNDERMFLASEKTDDAAVIQNKPIGESSEISVVFGGDRRLSCTMKLVPNESGTGTSKSLEEGSSESKAIEEDILPSEDQELDTVDDWIHENLICVDCNRSDKSTNHAAQKLASKWKLALVGKPKPVDARMPIRLRDKVIIPQEDDDIICRTIRSDQVAYKALCDTITNKIKTMLPNDVIDLCGTIPPVYKNFTAVEASYTKQRIWRKVALAMYKGMRDQGSDFNKHEAESVPASWTLKVAGRNLKGDKSEDPEPQGEDAICMCCFDGSSDDTNCILYCDGCNVALHQACYGVQEIPEGDFFCDRCAHIRLIADTHGFEIFDNHSIDPKSHVMCCLCPVKHGGLKPTTDGRWVHLCCAVWSQTASIADLSEMGPVDVSSVLVQIPTEANAVHDYQLETLAIVEDRRVLKETCIFCDAYGGFVLRCAGDGDGSDRRGPPCPTVFHPLCAWFQGIFVETSLIDPSFQGTDRGGIYPSCLQFKFCCVEHSPLDKKDRMEQFKLRCKYRLNEDDLEGIPGHNKRRKKKKAPKPQTIPGHKNVRVASGGSNESRELSVDVYKPTMCGVCLAPIDSVVPEDELSSFKKLLIKDKSVDSTQLCETTAAALSHQHTCAKCGIVVHKRCLLQLHLPYRGGTTTNSDGVPNDHPAWNCETCQQGLEDPRCSLCPRRGGFLVPMFDNSWGHPFCVRFVPGSVRRDSETGLIEVRNIPKENKKQKCVVCHRKNGVSVCCSFVGCSSYFHPLCAERSGKGFLRYRFGVNETYCFEHIPEGLEKIPSSGFWADSDELRRLRYTLDRSRLIFDTIVRRERFKRNLNKVEGECFLEKCNRLLDRAKGRKPESGIGADIYVDYDSSDGELDYEDDNDVEVTNKRVTGRRGRTPAVQTAEWIPLPDYIKSKSKLPAAPLSVVNDATDLTTDIIQRDDSEMISEEVTCQVNPMWTELVEKVDSQGAAASNSLYGYKTASQIKSLALASSINISVLLAGIEVARQESIVELAPGAYLKTFKERVQLNLESSRLATQLFSSQREFADFSKKLAPSLLKHLHMPISQFKTEMRMAGIVLDEGTSHSGRKSRKDESLAAKSSTGESSVVVTKVRVPKGFALIDEDEVPKEAMGKGKNSWIDEIATVPYGGSRSSKLAANSKISAIGKRIRSPTYESDGFESDPEVEVKSAYVLKKEARLAAEVAAAEAKVKAESKMKKKPNAPAPVSAQQTISSVKGGNESRTKASTMAADHAPVAISKRGRSSDVVEQNTAVDQPLKKKIRTSKSSDAPEVLHVTELSGPEPPLGPELIDSNEKATRIPAHDEKFQDKASDSGKEYLGRIPLQVAVNAHPLSKSIFQNKTLEAVTSYDILFAGFNVSLVSPIVSDLGTNVEGENEWLLFTSDGNLPQLERRIQEVLRLLETYNINYDPAKQLANEAIGGSSNGQVVTSRRKSSQGRKKKKKGPAVGEVPLLVEEFAEIPADFLPEYQTYVRHVVTIDGMKEKLRKHDYRCMAAFSRDFYEMLNNARSVTPPDSQLWTDTSTLAHIFEDLKVKSRRRMTIADVGLTDESVPKAVPPQSIEVKRHEKSKVESSSVAVDLTCCECKRQFSLEKWPAEMLSSDTITIEFPPTQFPAKLQDFSAWVSDTLDSLSSQTFQYPPNFDNNDGLTKLQKKAYEGNMRAEWLQLIRQAYPVKSVICPSCIHANCQTSILGRCVEVWWHEDSCKYQGYVNAYDEVSGKHRVMYDDGEWEFLDLKGEAVLFSAPCTSAVTSTEQSSSSSSSSEASPRSTSNNKKAVEKDASMKSKSHKKKEPTTPVPVIESKRTSSRISSTSTNISYKL